ncbi:hypothetical protein ONS96_011270 [Cadophora gregata f. sp. sojae]|nr:hypothetical protein ONS96_011270 [Cadophora gregata f. sp. sojae]
MDKQEQGRINQVRKTIVCGVNPLRESSDHHDTFLSRHFPSSISPCDKFSPNTPIIRRHEHAIKTSLGPASRNRTPTDMTPDYLTTMESSDEEVPIFSSPNS